MSGFIYAIACGERIKIGYSTQPDARFSKIASDAPFPCELLGFWPGTTDDEAVIHREFSDVRVHGEWFASTRKLRLFIGEMSWPLISTPTVRLPSRVIPISHRFNGCAADNLIKHIRLNIFRIQKQAEFAAVIGVSQAAVSRMESGAEIFISTIKSIRSAAFARGLDWDDALLFEFRSKGNEVAA